MAMHDAAAQKATARHCDQPHELLVLCTEHCPYEDCTARDGCKEYKAIKRALKEGKEFSYPQAWQPGESAADVDPGQPYLDAAWARMNIDPSICIAEPAPLPPDCAALSRLNRAIQELAELSPQLWGEVDISDMLSTLRAMRSRNFDHLVDWDLVALYASQKGESS